MLADEVEWGTYVSVICSNCGAEYGVENWNRRYEAFCQECIRTGQRPMSATGWVLRVVVRVGALVLVVLAGSLLLRLL